MSVCYLTTVLSADSFVGTPSLRCKSFRNKEVIVITGMFNHINYMSKEFQNVPIVSAEIAPHYIEVNDLTANKPLFLNIQTYANLT
jgi:hypothetical protein